MKVNSAVHTVTFVAVALLVVAAGPLCWGSSPAMPDLRPPLADEMLAAAALEDEAERQESFGRLLEESLFGGDYNTRLLALELLRSMAPWFDLTPYDRLASDLAAAGDISLSIILDRQELEQLSRDDKVAILRTAIVDGSVRLRRGTGLDRPIAMQMAAERGLVELRDAVEQHYPLLSAQFARSYPLDRFRLELSLTAGGGTLEQGMAAAAERLAAMDGCRYRSALQDDELFREVVRSFTERACIVSPIDGHQKASCEGYYRLFQREWSRGPVEPPALDEELDAWLRIFTPFQWQGKPFTYLAGYDRRLQLKQLVEEGYGIAEAKSATDAAQCEAMPLTVPEQLPEE